VDQPLLVSAILDCRFVTFNRINVRWANQAAGGRANRQDDPERGKAGGVTLRSRPRMSGGSNRFAGAKKAAFKGLPHGFRT
jgi:hypothetical protein